MCTQCAYCVPPFQIYIGPQESPFMGYGLLWVMGYGETKIGINASSSLRRLFQETMQTLSKISFRRKVSNSIWAQDVLPLDWRWSWGSSLVKAAGSPLENLVHRGIGASNLASLELAHCDSERWGWPCNWSHSSHSHYSQSIHPWDCRCPYWEEL